MEQMSSDSSVTYYDAKYKTQIFLTFTKEKTIKEVEEELSSLLEPHYISKILGKP